MSWFDELDDDSRFFSEEEYEELTDLDENFADAWDSIEDVHHVAGEWMYDGEGFGDE